MVRLSALVVMAASLGACATSGEEPGPSSIDGLGFLAGSWSGDFNATRYDETWTEPAHGNMTGAFRWFAGPSEQGEVAVYELLVFEEDETHGIVYRLRHFDGDMKPWASEADGPRVYRVELTGKNSARLIPVEPPREGHWIDYVRESSDELIATITEPDQSDPLTLRYRRVTDQ